MTLQGHTDYVISAIFNSDGTQVLTTSLDNTARLWDLERGTSVVLPQDLGEIVSEAAKQNNRNQAFTYAAVDALAQLATNWSPSGAFQNQDDLVLAAAFGGDRVQVVTTTNNTAQVWDLNRGESVQLEGHTDQIRMVAFDRDRAQLVTTSIDGTARVWNIASGESVELRDSGQLIARAIFNPSGTQVLTTFLDNTARIWDLTSGESLQLEGHTDTILGAAFNHDGTQVVTTSDDKTARVWALASLEELIIQGCEQVAYYGSYMLEHPDVLTSCLPYLSGQARVNASALLTTAQPSEAPKQ